MSGGVVDNNDDDSQEIEQTHSWEVIAAYFEEKGLVRQQIDSFDDFIMSSAQEIVAESPDLLIKPQLQSSTLALQTARAPNWLRISFGQLHMAKPIIKEKVGAAAAVDLYPRDARLRNLTYSAPMYVDVTKTIIVAPGTPEAHEDVQVIPKVFIGKVPIMVRSHFCHLDGMTDDEMMRKDECPYDQGGYFIVNGSEKVVVAHERMANNLVYVYPRKSGDKYNFVAEIRSSPELSQKSAAALYVGVVTQSARIEVTMPYIKQPVPLFIVFRALGVADDKSIVERVVYDTSDTEMLELLRSSIHAGAGVHGAGDALDYIGRRGAPAGAGAEARANYARGILQRELLPHIGVDATPGGAQKKAYFLGYMVRRVLLAKLGRRIIDDRDHYAVKRLDLAGPLMAILFRQLFRRMTDDVKKAVYKSLQAGKEPKITAAIKPAIITNGLKYALATGNWPQQKSGAGGVRSGVAQVLNRLTYLATLSHLRRLNTPIGREGKVAKPRQLHNMHWGVVCPSETPEGQACGLTKNMALMAYISVSNTSVAVRGCCTEFGVVPIAEMTRHDLCDAVKVFVNGEWLGIHRAPWTLVGQLRKLRRLHQGVAGETSIVYDTPSQEIRISTDQGRALRPLYVVDRGRLLVKRVHIKRLHERHNADVQRQFTWSSLIANGLVEYLDVAEQETSMIAMHVADVAAARTDAAAVIRTHTHAEIHPSMILGVCAAVIPFPDHNQSPRNTYQSAMGKQAMGIYISNYQQRFDVMSNVLYYPQKPLVGTEPMRHTHFNELPAGINAVVAIMAYTGYNQEDSVLMNQSAIDRGLFRSVQYKTYVDKEKRDAALSNAEHDELIDQFEVPSETTCAAYRKPINYRHLDSDGLVGVASRVTSDDIIVGKTTLLPASTASSSSSNARSHAKRDVSKSVQSGEVSLVDDVMVSTTADGVRLVKIRTRSVRVPQIGDKFSSRHGQKGTMGMAYRQEDMPFTIDGMTPDIVVNPHAIPSRMTIGQLVECLQGKVAALMGEIGDATPFTGDNVDDFCDALHALGFQKRGNETMFSGASSKQTPAQVFIGPTYYQRLKHMVADKVHARARGPTSTLVRQPLEGRGRNGGLRFGEMERDAVIAHGASMFLRDRTFENSDKYRLHVCKLCGMTAIANLKLNTFRCRRCTTKTEIESIDMPYAMKLLIQELTSMSLAVRIFK